jgi:hypothetical protein
MKSSGPKPSRLVSFFGLVLLFASFALSSCSKNSTLAGKWQEKGASVIVDFNTDGTFKFSGGEPMTGTYSFNGSELTFNFDGDLGKALGAATEQATLEGDTLTIRDSKKDAPEVYTRVK